MAMFLWSLAGVIAMLMAEFLHSPHPGAYAAMAFIYGANFGMALQRRISRAAGAK